MSEKLYTQTEVDDAYFNGTIDGMIQSNRTVLAKQDIIETAVIVAAKYIEQGVNVEKEILRDLMTVAILQVGD